MQSFLTEALNYTHSPLTPAQRTAFEVFERELLNWNQKFNLTAIRDPEGIRVKHFLDSLSCLSAMKGLSNERVIDVGTGAGFPGIPLKIVRPELRLTLVESVGKKAGFCTHLVDVLQLKNVEVLTLRAEEVGRLTNHRAQYDWAVARAVAALPILAEYLLPLLKIGGTMLAQKGESAHVEVQSCTNAFNLLGGELINIVPVTLPGIVEERFLVSVRKKSATPPAYPRPVGIPAKKPL